MTFFYAMACFTAWRLFMIEPPGMLEKNWRLKSEYSKITAGRPESESLYFFFSSFHKHDGISIAGFCRWCCRWCFRRGKGARASVHVGLHDVTTPQRTCTAKFSCAIPKKVDRHSVPHRMMQALRAFVALSLVATSIVAVRSLWSWQRGGHKAPTYVDIEPSLLSLTVGRHTWINLVRK